MKPLGNRIVVTSRGIKEEAGGVIMPKQFLRDSNICITDNGDRVIVRDNSGFDIGDHRRIVGESDVLAFIKDDGAVSPTGKIVLLRKCIDPEEIIITSLSKNKSQFAEIIAVGSETMLEGDVGSLAYVSDLDGLVQKVEETEADFLIEEDAILMTVELEE
jgi:co-chaperonin GroES (HSP10)